MSDYKAASGEQAILKIRELEAELDGWKDSSQRSWKETEDFRQENIRLREALKAIAGCDDDYANGIARAALERK